MSSVTKRIKRNMGELETGRRGKRLGSTKRVNRRVARAERRLKERS